MEELELLWDFHSATFLVEGLPIIMSPPSCLAHHPWSSTKPLLSFEAGLDRSVAYFGTREARFRAERSAPSQEDSNSSPSYSLFAISILQANDKVMPKSLLYLCGHVFPHVNADSKKSLLSHTSATIPMERLTSPSWS